MVSLGWMGPAQNVGRDGEILCLNSRYILLKGSEPSVTKKMNRNTNLSVIEEHYGGAFDWYPHLERYG